MLSTRKHLKGLIRSRDERAETKSYCRDKQLVYFALIMGILRPELVSVFFRPDRLQNKNSSASVGSEL